MCKIPAEGGQSLKEIPLRQGGINATCHPARAHICSLLLLSIFLKFLHCFDTTKLFAKPLAATVLFANGCNVPEVKD